MARSTKAPTTKHDTIKVTKLRQAEVTFCLLGTTPFYCNRVAAKAQRELLLPRGRLTLAQKADTLKHNPDAEFRDSAYRQRGDAGATRILMKGTAIKGAIGQTAIDMPSPVAKAQIDRLTYVVEEYIEMWGIPLLDMAVVRMADINRTPDIRTRARLNRWATRITLRYTLPMLSSQKVATLLAGSGIICGIGDFRQQKGKGNNGLFQIVAEDDERYQAVIREGGLARQDEAFAQPQFSNFETEDLYTWYHAEVLRRQDEPAPPDGDGDAPPIEFPDEFVRPPYYNGEEAR